MTTSRFFREIGQNHFFKLKFWPILTILVHVVLIKIGHLKRCVSTSRLVCRLVPCRPCRLVPSGLGDYPILSYGHTRESDSECFESPCKRSLVENCTRFNGNGLRWHVSERNDYIQIFLERFRKLHLTFTLSALKKDKLRGIFRSIPKVLKYFADESFDYTSFTYGQVDNAILCNVIPCHQFL